MFIPLVILIRFLFFSSSSFLYPTGPENNPSLIRNTAVLTRPIPISIFARLCEASLGSPFAKALAALPAATAGIKNVRVSSYMFAGVATKGRIVALITNLANCSPSKAFPLPTPAQEKALFKKPPPSFITEFTNCIANLLAAVCFWNVSIAPCLCVSSTTSFGGYFKNIFLASPFSPLFFAI